MIRLQKPRRVYVFPSLRTVKPKPFNHTQPSNQQKSLYLLPVCPFAVLLLFCSLTTLTPFLAEGAYKCKTNPERVSRRTPVGVCVATETPPGGVSPVFYKRSQSDDSWCGSFENRIKYLTMALSSAAGPAGLDVKSRYKQTNKQTLLYP